MSLDTVQMPGLGEGPISCIWTSGSWAERTWWEFQVQGWQVDQRPQVGEDASEAQNFFHSWAMSLRWPNYTNHTTVRRFEQSARNKALRSVPELYFLVRNWKDPKPSVTKLQFSVCMEACAISNPGWFQPTHKRTQSTMSGTSTHHWDGETDLPVIL